jgi:hypothetical protein
MDLFPEFSTTRGGRPLSQMKAKSPRGLGQSSYQVAPIDVVKSQVTCAGWSTLYPTNQTSIDPSFLPDGHALAVLAQTAWPVQGYGAAARPATTATQGYVIQNGCIHGTYAANNIGQWPGMPSGEVLWRASYTGSATTGWAIQIQVCVNNVTMGGGAAAGAAAAQAQASALASAQAAQAAAAQAAAQAAQANTTSAVVSGTTDQGTVSWSNYMYVYTPASGDDSPGSPPPGQTEGQWILYSGTPLFVWYPKDLLSPVVDPSGNTWWVYQTTDMNAIGQFGASLVTAQASGTPSTTPPPQLAGTTGSWYMPVPDYYVWVPSTSNTALLVLLGILGIGVLGGVVYLVSDSSS